MAEMISLYNADDDSVSRNPGVYRRLAVEAALELIRSAASGTHSHDRLDEHIANLSQYADVIQQALAKKASSP